LYATGTATNVALVLFDVKISVAPFSTIIVSPPMIDIVHLVVAFVESLQVIKAKVVIAEACDNFTNVLLL
jgi:hypothetical protein